MAYSAGGSSRIAASAGAGRTGQSPVAPEMPSACTINAGDNSCAIFVTSRSVSWAEVGTGIRPAAMQAR